MLMAQDVIRFDATKLVGKLNALTEIQLPRAASMALNKALFETRGRLKAEAQQVFQAPVPFTLNSFLYQKPEQKGDDLDFSIPDFSVSLTIIVSFTRRFSSVLVKREIQTVSRFESPSSLTLNS